MALVAGVTVAALILSPATVAAATTGTSSTASTASTAATAASTTAASTTTSTTTTPGGASRPKPTASEKKAEAAFQKCLSSHGVTLPSRPSGGSGAHPYGGTTGGTFPSGSGGFHGGPGGGATSTKFSKAFADCKKLAPKGFGGGFGGGSFDAKPTAAQQQALATYEQCMSSHGVTIAANSTFKTIESLIKDDPTAAKANKDCESDLKTAFSRPTSSGAGSSG